MRSFIITIVFLAASTGSHAVDAEGRLPDGGTASFREGKVAKAWYSSPTDRYDHGVLGDAIEGGSLTIQTRDGSLVTHKLESAFLFEDITPRLADLNGDGTAEVITILSSVDKGASLAVFELKAKALTLLDKTAFIGKTHRWLNVAGIADYDGDGQTDIAFVLTPHLGGALQFWTLNGSRLVQIGSMPGFSNHVIGTRDLAMSATMDADSDGKPEIAVPSADRSTVRQIEFREGQLNEIATFALTGKAVGNFELQNGSKLTIHLNSGQTKKLSLN